MKNRTLAILASVFALALAIAPSLPAQQIPPVNAGVPLLTDQEQLIRAGQYGNVLNPNYTLGQEFQLAFSGVTFPQGGYTGTFTLATGVFAITPSLFTSPLAVTGYSTGIGTGQSVTQLTNKSTAVVMPAGCWTGVITMNNASLAGAANVSFTVTDTNIQSTDIVVCNAQLGSITAAAAYQFSTVSSNGSFVVNVFNGGTTESDAIKVNFFTVRASGN